HPSWLAPVLLTLSLLLVVAALGLEIAAYVKSRAHAFRSDSRFNRFMLDWIGQGGRVVIFTRDMSWAHGEVYRSVLRRLFRRPDDPDPIFDLLKRKAKRG